MQAVQEWILGIADQWWVHLVVAACALVDGFFPTVPSESVLVALGSLASSNGYPLVIPLILAGWAGACCGDHVAYAIGLSVGWEKIRFFREGRGRTAINAAEMGLQHHAFVFFVTARFIPLGRTAVNLAAGATKYPQGRFTSRIVVATLLWSAYSTMIGFAAGHWFQEHPLLGVVSALVVAFGMSVVLERLAHGARRALARRSLPRE